jgi:hypothetical protein
MIDPRIREYEAQHNCLLIGKISMGPGQDGFVQRSNRFTAVKFFDRPDRFSRELEVYQVVNANLHNKGIHKIAGHDGVRSYPWIKPHKAFFSSLATDN